MDDDGTPNLAIGLLIEADYAVLQQIQAMMASTEMKILREAKSIEAATKGMISPAATMQISAFGSTAGKELRSVARETAFAEKAGEKLSAQLQREAESFGLTRHQMRAAKIEAAALRAEQSGLIELSERLRSQQAALVAQQEQAALAAATSTEALAKLRAQYNPLFAIGQQYKAEVTAIKNAHALGAISADEMADALARAKTQAAAGATAFRTHGNALDKAGEQSGAMRQAMMGASYQVQDFMTQVSMGANPLNAFAVQGGQLAGQFANVGGKAGAVASFFMGPWGLAITGAVMVLGMLTKGLFDGSAAAEEKAKAAKALAAEMDGVYASNMRAIKSEQWLQQETLASAQAMVVKAQEARKATLETYKAARAELDFLNRQTFNPATQLVNWFAKIEVKDNVSQLEKQLEADIKRVEEQKLSLKATEFKGIMDSVRAETDAAYASTVRFDTERDKIAKMLLADQIDKGEAQKRLLALTRDYNAEQKRLSASEKGSSRSDHASERRAASIQREVNLIQEQVSGQLALAQAYGVSDVAALQALATMKAHEKAIRKQADIDKFVADEMRRTVAERIATTAKASADLNYQGRVQQQVNDMVRAGTLDVSRMGEVYSDLIGQREILAAMDLAGQSLDTDAMAAAVEQLLKLKNAQAETNKLRRETQDLQRSKELRDEIAQMKELAEITKTHGQARLDILMFGNGGFAQEQALAAANAASEKALILSRANTEADKARKDGLLATADAILAKAKAEIAAVDTSLGLQTAEEAIGRLRDAANGLDLASPFGRAGAAVRDMVDSMKDLREAQDLHRAAVQAAGGDATQIARADALYQNAKVASTMKQISAAKSLFKENSAGYKAMAAAEKAYAMVQLANTAVNVAAGAAKMFASLGPWAFPVVAAMVGVMAALGFGGGGGGGSSAAPKSSEDLQSAIGTGTVYGDSSAKSESLAKALDILSANSNSDLEYSNQMLRTLRSIDGGIDKLAGQLGAQIGLGAAGMFDTSKLNIGSSGSSGVLGIGASSTTRTLYDQGLHIYGQSIDQILAGQFNAQVYNVVQKVKKKSGFLGIGGGTKTSYSTSYNAINHDIRTAFADIIGSVSDGVVDVMAQYDVQLATNLRSAMLAFKLPELKFSTAGMNADEIETALQNYFSSVADQLSGLAAKQLPVLNELQKNGEGMFETLSRVIKTFGSVNIGLSSIGMAGFGSSEAGLKGASQLTDLFGDLDSFQDGMSKYSSKFLTEAERMAPIIAAVRTEMARLDMAGVATNDQFKSVVSSLELSTDAGRETFAALMAVAPAFAKVTDYLGDLNNSLGESAEIAKKRRDLEIQIMELQGRTLEATAAKREKELLALEEALRPLQLYIYALQDEAAAKASLKTAYDRESKDIITLRDKYADLGKSMREYRDSLLPQVSSGNAYAQAMADFQSASGAAGLGDADAMARLSGLGQNLLTLSSENAASQIEYLRAVAMVKQGMDGAIGAADEAMDYQQAQLDALEAIVANHIDLNDNVIRVAEAIEAIEASQSGIVDIGASMGQIPIVNAVTNISTDNAALRQDIAELTTRMDRVANFAERTAAAAEKTNREYLARWNDNDAIRTREAD